MWTSPRSGQRTRIRSGNIIKSCFNGPGAVITAVYSSNSKREPASAGINSGHEKTSTAGRESNLTKRRGAKLQPLVRQRGSTRTSSPAAQPGAQPTFPEAARSRGRRTRAGASKSRVSRESGRWARERGQPAPGQPLSSSPAPSQSCPPTWLAIAESPQGPVGEGPRRTQKGRGPLQPPPQPSDSPGARPESLVGELFLQILAAAAEVKAA